MTHRITAPYPASGVVALTEVYRSDDPNGPFTIVDVLSGLPTRDEYGRFLYEDYLGAVEKFYRVVFYDAMGVVLGDSAPFSMNTVGGPDMGLRIRIDHNRSLEGTFVHDALRCVAEGGEGIPDLHIRVYREADYDAGHTDLALGLTLTLEDGRWAAPIFVEPGQTYVVHISKEEWGPVTRRVTV